MFSQIHESSPVSFPLFNNERHYMIPFRQKDGLPRDLSHWQTTVDQMLEGIETDEPIYFMADQKFVLRGEPQRRPGVHVDGYWIPSISAHGGGHLPSPPLHGPGRHRIPGRHFGVAGRYEQGSWGNADFSEPEALILASNVSASRAYVGEFDGPIGEGGDCSHLSLSRLDVVDLESHKAYVGTVGTLHESLPVNQDCFRTLVRLNCPGVTIQ